MLLYDSLNLTVSGVKLWTVIRPYLRKLTVLHCSSWTVLNTRCTGCTVLLKDKIVINDTVIAYNICWDSKLCQQYCPLTFTPMLDKNNSHFRHSDRHNERLGKHQCVRVTYCRILCSLPRSCLVHTVDRFDSDGWFSCDQVIFLKCVSYVCCEKHAAFKWKDAISGFAVYQVVQKWGGKIKYILIVYFLSNIYAKIIKIDSRMSEL